MQIISRFNCPDLNLPRWYLAGLLAWSAVAVAQVEPTAAGLESPAAAIGTEEEQAAAAAARAKAAREAEEAARQEARIRELTLELSQRQQAITDLQSAQGVYDPALIEAHDDIARLYIELEDYGSAAQSLNEALQIIRINTGLYSEQQRPLIDQLIDNHARMEQWIEVDDLVHLDHHISSRLYAPVDSQYLDAAGDYGEWKLRVLRENLLQLNSRGLMNTAEDLSSFYGRVLMNIEFSEEVEPENLVSLLNGKSRADMALARNIANTPYTYFQGTANRYVTQQRCQNRRNAAGQLVRQCVKVQVENPRYRQSQQEAKRLALYRYTNEIDRTLERLRMVKDGSNSLTVAQRADLETQITQLQMEASSLHRRRGGFRF